ncbi:tyrosine-type recombinase/integrase [Streptomyces sp. NPDC057854]|uniref:tyrosine-type recombinase/integrase n=1 Tax=unclassified Streptomyces TaxID=2593676 RepID=UPI00368780F4
MRASPDLHEAYIAYRDAMKRRHVPAGTIRTYERIARQLAAAYPRRHFAGLTRDDLADFLYGKDGILHGLYPNTATTYRAALRSFLRYGVEQGWVRQAPALPEPAFRQRGPKPQIPPTRLTEAELALVMERAPNPIMRGVVAVAIFTALRISDVRKIKIQDLNIHTGELAVWIQKTGAYDEMPVTLDLEEEIRSYMGWYTTNVGPALPDHYMFPGFDRHAFHGRGMRNYDPTRCISYQWCHNQLKPLYADCGIRVESREAWHVLRRSAARIYFDRLRHDLSHDHALRQTMVFLGHQKAETTERYLGVQAEIAARNESLRGKRFLTAAPENVVDLNAYLGSRSRRSES